MRQLSTNSAKENMVGFLSLIANLKYHVFNLFKNHQADFAKYEMHRRILTFAPEGQVSAFVMFYDKCRASNTDVKVFNSGFEGFLNNRPLNVALSDLSNVFNAKKQLIKDEASDKKSFRSALLVGGMDIGCWFLPKFGPVGFALSLGLATFATVYSYSQSKDSIESGKVGGISFVCSILGRTLRGKFGFICSTILGFCNACTIFPGIRKNLNVEAEFNLSLDQAIGAAYVVQNHIQQGIGGITAHAKQSLQTIYNTSYRESSEPDSETTSLADSVKKALELNRLKDTKPLKSYVEKLQAAEAKKTMPGFDDIAF